MRKDFDDSDSMVNSFNSILLDNANKSAIQKKPNIKVKIKSKRKPWFSESCIELHNSVKNYEKMVNKFPQNAQYRKSFYSLRAQYRRRCKYEEKVYRQKICNEINNNMENDPKNFWSLINKLSNTSSGVVSDNVPHKEFVQHFKNLNSEDNNPNQFQQHIVKILNELINKLETDNRVNKLNDQIKPEEIIKAIRK